MDYGRLDSIIFSILDNIIHKVCGILSEYNKNNSNINIKKEHEGAYLLNDDTYSLKLNEAVQTTMLELSAINVLLTLEEGIDLVSKLESAIIDDLCTQIPDLNTEYIKVNEFIYLGNMVIKLDVIVSRDET
jgi:hypothetical protein